MSAVLTLAPATARRLALLGTGTVGTAFVQRYQSLLARGVALPQFSWLANSRTARACGHAPEQELQLANLAARTAPALQPWADTDGLQRGDVVVDATASDEVANRHEQWLARGVHVVTANKLGQGAQLARAQAIADSRQGSDAQYGDSATVGAGLPLLSSLRALVAGGDRIHRVEGVLSGSLAWLFHHYDGQRAFSDWVREAARAGYTEPDPRVDLSGEDVRRKLLILARPVASRCAPGRCGWPRWCRTRWPRCRPTRRWARCRSLMRRCCSTGTRHRHRVAACASSAASTTTARRWGCASCRSTTRWRAGRRPTTGWRSTATVISSSRC